MINVPEHLFALLFCMRDKVPQIAWLTTNLLFERAGVDVFSEFFFRNFFSPSNLAIVLPYFLACRLKAFFLTDLVELFVLFFIKANLALYFYFFNLSFSRFFIANCSSICLFNQFSAYVLIFCSLSFALTTSCTSFFLYWFCRNFLDLSVEVVLSTRAIFLLVLISAAADDCLSLSFVV